MSRLPFRLGYRPESSRKMEGRREKKRVGEIVEGGREEREGKLRRSKKKRERG